MSSSSDDSPDEEFEVQAEVQAVEPQLPALRLREAALKAEHAEVVAAIVKGEAAAEAAKRKAACRQLAKKKAAAPPVAAAEANKSLEETPGQFRKTPSCGASRRTARSAAGSQGGFFYFLL
jgi:hypothetical protein